MKMQVFKWVWGGNKEKIISQCHRHTEFLFNHDAEHLYRFAVINTDIEEKNKLQHLIDLVWIEVLWDPSML